MLCALLRAPVALAPQARKPAVVTSTARLTGREVDVLRLRAQGLSGSQIAAHLHLARSTVAAHLSSAYRKLGATRDVTAIDTARRLGYLSSVLSARDARTLRAGVLAAGQSVARGDRPPASAIHHALALLQQLAGEPLGTAVAS